MAGAYCKFCGRRCFLYRIVPDGPSKGWGGHMATCAKGRELDLKVLGHTHITAVNPVTEPELAEAIGAWAAGRRGRRAAAIAVEAGEYTWFSGQVDAMFPDPAQAPGVDRMTDADWLGIAYDLGSPLRHFPLVKSYWNKAGQEAARG